MKLNWKTFVVALSSVAALLVMSAVIVVSQGPQERRPGPPGDGYRRNPGPRDGMLPMLHGLNLSDEQKAQIKKILDDEATNTKDLREKLRSLHQSEPEPFSSTFDEAAVRLAAEERAKIDVELQVAHARTMSQVAALLTADQKAQLTARRQQFREGPPPAPPIQP